MLPKRPLLLCGLLVFFGTVAETRAQNVTELQVLPENLTIVVGESGTAIATHVAVVSESGTADIAFFPDGTLYAITGNGAANAETLWRVDKATGAMTSIFVLQGGSGGPGESIAAIPAQLIGPLTILPGGGVAVFNGIAINAPATGFRLTATSPGLASAVSIIFDIN